MAYNSWSVVFSEQPSAAKWNILGANDASFNDSTGINLQYANLAGLSNPYKFSAYHSTTQAANNGVWTPLSFDTEEFDTNNNFASNTYTAPVAGFYSFSASAIITPGSAGDRYGLRMTKNGTPVKTGSFFQAGGTSSMSVPFAVSCFQLAASDAMRMEIFNSTGASKTVSGGSDNTYFNGVLLSKT